MLRVGEGVTQFCRPVSGIAMNAPGVCPAVIPDDRIVERQETVDFASCHSVVPSCCGLRGLLIVVRAHYTLSVILCQ